MRASSYTNNFNVLSLLRQDYEYLTSEEVVREMIDANGYEFYENGELY